MRTGGNLLRHDEDLPAAIVCFNDSTARGVAQAWEAVGFDWKGRIAITGWDNSVAASLIDLTSVAMPTHELGQQAADLLLQRLALHEPRKAVRHVVLPGSLVARTSTAMQESPDDEDP